MIETLLHTVSTALAWLASLRRIARPRRPGPAQPRPAPILALPPPVYPQSIAGIATSESIIVPSGAPRRSEGGGRGKPVSPPLPPIVLPPPAQIEADVKPLNTVETVLDIAVDGTRLVPTIPANATEVSPGAWLLEDDKLEQAEELQRRRGKRPAGIWDRDNDPLIKARKALDKFVTPKGPEPVKHERGPVAPQPAAEPAPDPLPTPDEPPDASIIMVDKIDGKEVGFFEEELYGEICFRDTILDQLERYWVYLRRMKKHDHDAYDLYSRLGAQIVPPATWFLHDGVHEDKDGEPKKRFKPELSPWWKRNRPAFGCVTYGLTSKIEAQELDPPKWKLEGTLEHGKKSYWIPKFLYFQKFVEPSPTVQPVHGPGDVYQVTVWWDRPNDTSKYRYKYGTPYEFAVWISAAGDQIKPLKMHKSWVEQMHGRSRHRINGKRGHVKRHHDFIIRRTGWVHCAEYRAWAKDNDDTVEDFLARLFVDAVKAWEFTLYSMTRIEVSNGDLTAVFSVDPKRMAYFFQDRDVTLTKGGAKEKVFHWVKPHKRLTKTGETIVPGHFRGLRDFEWAGYHVHITVPGRDHFSLAEYDIGVYDGDFIEKNKIRDGLTMKQNAQWLSEALHKGAQKGNFPALPRPNKNQNWKKRG